MPKAEEEIVIHAPRSRVFEVITDYESYPEFLPDMKVVTVESREGNVAVVSFELELVMRVSYTLRLTESPPHKIRWSLERAKMITENEGGWDLTETPEGHTHARYGLEIKLRGLIPKSVSTRLLGQTLPQTLERFKARAEGAA